MTKKLLISVFIGILAIVTTACGSNENEQQAGSDDAKDQYDSIYRKSLFLGDSLLNGLSDVLYESNVISNAGATAQFAFKEVDNIAIKKPEHLFIMLGSDDLLWPVDNPMEHSLKHYTKLIKEIKEKLPNTSVHIISVPPVTKDVMEVEPRYKNIPAYNQALTEMTEIESIDYIDLTPLFENQQDLYKEDGIHFKADFYPLFLNYIKEHITPSNKNEGIDDKI